MPLGAITDIEHARGLAPRNTARGAWVAFGSLGEGGVVSHAGAPRNFQTAPEGYSEGRQPGAALNADPAQRALTAALGCAPDGAGITSAEGSEARRISFRRHQPGPSRDGGEAATLAFLLNKGLNGVDLYHEIDLSDTFVLGHTVGLVFAKANYGEDCVYHQNCTIGRNGDDRPTLGAGVSRRAAHQPRHPRRLHRLP